MALNTASLLRNLAARHESVSLYSYRIPRKLTFGCWGLSAVLVVYGASFGDVSWVSARKRQEFAKETEKRDWKYVWKSYSPLALTILPLTFAIGTVYVFSRVVTRISFIPAATAGGKGLQKSVSYSSGSSLIAVERKSPVSGRPMTVTRRLGDVVKTKRIRIFTGAGANGLDDRGTFVFYLVDRTPGISIWNRYYIVSRSGDVWKSDGRVLESVLTSSRDIGRIMDGMGSHNANLFHESHYVNTRIKDIVVNAQQQDKKKA